MPNANACGIVLTVAVTDELIISENHETLTTHIMSHEVDIQALSSHYAGVIHYVSAEVGSEGDEV